MSLIDLAILYLVGGLASAVYLWRQSGEEPLRARLSSVALALVAWPLWLPFAARGGDEPRPEGPRAERIATILEDTVDAAKPTPYASMFQREAVGRITAEVAEVEARLDELRLLLARPDFDRHAAAQQLERLQRDGASTAQLRTAALHLDNIARLERLRLEQEGALADLERLLGALRSQLLVARYAGTESDGVEAILGDLWARVEGLGAAMDAEAWPEVDPATNSPAPADPSVALQPDSAPVSEEHAA